MRIFWYKKKIGKFFKILLALIILYKMITDNACFTQILISLSGLIAGSPAILLQAALRLRPAYTRTAVLPAIKPLSEIKI